MNLTRFEMEIDRHKKLQEMYEDMKILKEKIAEINKKLDEMEKSSDNKKGGKK